MVLVLVIHHQTKTAIPTQGQTSNVLTGCMNTKVNMYVWLGKIAQQTNSPLICHIHVSYTSFVFIFHKTETFSQTYCYGDSVMPIPWIAQMVFSGVCPNSCAFLYVNEFSITQHLFTTACFMLHCEESLSSFIVKHIAANTVFKIY